MAMQGRLSPGVYREEITIQPAPQLNTGVPAFLGLVAEAAGRPVNQPVRLNLWAQFLQHFGATTPGYLADSVNGFFHNGGRLCYVTPVQPAQTTTDKLAALKAALAASGTITDVDLVCAPDIAQPLVEHYRQGNSADFEQGKHKLVEDISLLQRALIEHCDLLGNRFAILDSLPCAEPDDPARCATPQDVIEQQQGLPRSANAGLYYPWLRLADSRYVPPCGAVAGVYARSDQRVGVHKAPANEPLEGIVDLGYVLDDRQNGELNALNINCLRAFPGRGIRVWGARTLSHDANWLYVNVRRLFITAGRWIDLNLMHTVFEPNVPALWAQIERDLTTYFNQLFQRGALKGAAPEESFYVHCNAETNPPDVRDAGMLVAEIGLAPTVPNEFVRVRIVRNATGIQIEL
jgi:hypothetical protein